MPNDGLMYAPWAGEVIAFAQMSFWLVIYNDPEAHRAAADDAGERTFSRADARNHTYVESSSWAVNSDFKIMRWRKDCLMMWCIESIFSYQG